MAYQIEFTSTKGGYKRYALVTPPRRSRREFLVAEQEQATTWKQLAAVKRHLDTFTNQFPGGTCEIVEVN